MIPGDELTLVTRALVVLAAAGTLAFIVDVLANLRKLWRRSPD